MRQVGKGAVKMYDRHEMLDVVVVVTVRRAASSLAT
jgi:hypothetical protein